MRKAMLCLALSLVAGPLAAQDGTHPGGAYFRLLAGAMVPLGDFADFFGTGWDVGGTIGWQLAGIPVSFDAEVAYHRASGEDGLDDLGLTSGTANVRWDAQTQSAAQFYVVGGVGVYRFSDYAVDYVIDNIQVDPRLRLGISGGEVEFESVTDFGLNIGAGVLLGRGRTRFFLESRYHTVFTEGQNTNFVPINIGVQFGPPRM